MCDLWLLGMFIMMFFSGVFVSLVLSLFCCLLVWLRRMRF